MNNQLQIANIVKAGVTHSEVFLTRPCFDSLNPTVTDNPVAFTDKGWTSYTDGERVRTYDFGNGVTLDSHWSPVEQKTRFVVANELIASHLVPSIPREAKPLASLPYNRKAFVKPAIAR